MTGLFVAAGVLTLSALISALAARHRRAPAVITAVGTVVAAISALPPSIGALAGAEPVEIALEWAAPIGELRFGLDALSAFFIVPLVLLGAVCAVYGAFYLDDQREKRWLAVPAAFYNVLVGGMLLVVISRDAIGFLIAWELMTLSSYALVVFDHAQPEVRRAGWIYLIASHLGVASVVCSLVLLGDHGFAFADILANPASGGTAVVAAVLALIGFGVKAGMVPLHVWLPEAHAAAPSHVSALMSGVLIKLGIYGVLRTITFLPDALPWGPLLLGLGVLGALVGISLALYQRDLKRALAYSMAAALDTGSSFEGMGAAREATFACLAEPAFVLGLMAIARATGSLSLSGFLGPAVVHVWSVAGASLVLVAAGLLVVLLAENSRIPVDDPSTHLELTMIHEVMVLDHSGPMLGAILYAAAIKLFVFATLLVRILIPVTGPPWLMWLTYLGGLVGVAVVIGVIESFMARLRLPYIPALLLSGCLFCGLAVVLLVR